MPDSTLKNRFYNCKKKIINDKSRFGEFWENARKTFKIEFANGKFCNKGSRNYYPAFYENYTDKKNYIFDHNTNLDKSNNSEIKINYIEINKLKFCNTIFCNNKSLVYSNYYLNLIKEKCDQNISTVLEIGAGAGVLTSMLQDQLNTKNIIIDIPEVLLCSIAFVMTVFPNKKILLPNEVNENHDISQYDFVFLLPRQKTIIIKDSIDLCINTAGFMEMEYFEIKEYFELINIVAKKNKYFLCVNRLRKKTFFKKYPWHKLNYFKCHHIRRNEYFLKMEHMPTYLDAIFVKNSNNNNNNYLSVSRRIKYNLFFSTEELIYWIKKDIKVFIKKRFLIFVPFLKKIAHTIK